MVIDATASSTIAGMRRQGRPPAAAQPTPPPQQKPAPAGATAPSDVGSDGAPTPATKPNTGQSPEAMQENIGKGWVTTPPQQRVG